MWEQLKQRAAIVLVSLLVGAVAAAFAMKAYRGFHTAFAATGWPEAEAVVDEQYRLDEVFDRQPRATAVVEYHYTVDGVAYSGEESRDKEPIAVAESLLDEYPVGHRFEIHYNPADPSESSIDPKFRAATVLHLVIAILAGVGALVVLYSAIRPSTEEETTE